MRSESMRDFRNERAICDNSRRDHLAGRDGEAGLLRDGKLQTRCESFRALRKIAEKGDKDFIDSIIPLLKEEHAKYEARVKLPNDRSVVDAVISLLQDVDFRKVSALCLQRFGSV